MQIALLRQKLKVTGWHLLASALVAACVLLLVLGLWYPFPYLELSEGTGLLKLIIGVDLVAGPFLTFLLYQPSKAHRTLILDLSVIGLLQLAALAYGLSTVMAARPVYTVFEKDLLRIVHASDVYVSPGTHKPSLPLNGPLLQATLLPGEASRRNQILTDALERGIYESYRPELWAPYESAHSDILQASQPLSLLLQKYPEAETLARKALKGKNFNLEELRYLPIVGRNFIVWTAVLHPDNIQPFAYFAFDPLAKN